VNNDERVRSSKQTPMVTIDYLNSACDDAFVEIANPNKHPSDDFPYDVIALVVNGSDVIDVHAGKLDQMSFDLAHDIWIKRLPARPLIFGYTSTLVDASLHACRLFLADHADGKTSEDADGKTSEDADGKTSEDADGKTSEDADGKTSEDADGKTSGCQYIFTKGKRAGLMCGRRMYNDSGTCKVHSRHVEHTAIPCTYIFTKGNKMGQPCGRRSRSGQTCKLHTPTTPSADSIPTPSADSIPTPSADSIPTPSPDSIPTPSPDSIPTPSPDTIPTPSPDTIHAIGDAFTPKPTRRVELSNQRFFVRRTDKSTNRFIYGDSDIIVGGDMRCVGFKADDVVWRLSSRFHEDNYMPWMPFDATRFVYIDYTGDMFNLLGTQFVFRRYPCAIAIIDNAVERALNDTDDIILRINELPSSVVGDDMWDTAIAVSIDNLPYARSSGVDTTVCTHPKSAPILTRVSDTTHARRALVNEIGGRTPSECSPYLVANVRNLNRQIRAHNTDINTSAGGQTYIDYHTVDIETVLDEIQF
jgi:hypothetical protein